MRSVYAVIIFVVLSSGRSRDGPIKGVSVVPRVSGGLAISAHGKGNLLEQDRAHLPDCRETVSTHADSDGQGLPPTDIEHG